jgi:hypothetical protein
LHRTGKELPKGGFEKAVEDPMAFVMEEQRDWLL